ncbi:MAG: lytic transglycosylase domain-containing protein [Flavobacterium sp.]
MKKLKLWTGVLVGLGVVLLMIQAKDNPLDLYQNWLPKNVHFAEEPTPVEIPDVRERLDRELLVNANWHSNTFLMIKRANRAFPVMEPILKQYGIPEDFKYLAVIESGLVNVVSPAGARGIWQFMPETAKMYGLEVSNQIDERYHLQKSTIAACKYLLDAKKKYGNWTLAAASYNAGMQGIQNRLDQQKSSNYYDLHLGEETSRYVFRIIAMKEVMENAQKYGYRLSPQELYYQPSVVTIKVTESIPSLVDFALQNGMNYKELKLLNPWLREDKLTVTNSKSYEIAVLKK